MLSDDPEFRAYLLRESQTILTAMAGTPLVKVLEGAIAQLTTSPAS